MYIKGLQELRKLGIDSGDDVFVGIVEKMIREETNPVTAHALWRQVQEKRPDEQPKTPPARPH